MLDVKNYGRPSRVSLLLNRTTIFKGCKKWFWGWGTRKLTFPVYEAETYIQYVNMYNLSVAVKIHREDNQGEKMSKGSWVVEGSIIMKRILWETLY